MKTDRLIEDLAGGLAPSQGWRVSVSIAAAAMVGGALALGLMVVWLGARPDLAEAARGLTFWMKAAYALTLGLAGFLALERLARPAGDGRKGFGLALGGFLLLFILAIVQLAGAPAEARAELVLGQSWRQCAIHIVLLAAPMLAISLLAARRLAPTRLVLAGAAAGLFSGGVAAAAYGLHCPETAPAFVAVWYSLGIALTTGVGAALGPVTLRWR